MTLLLDYEYVLLPYWSDEGYYMLVLQCHLVEKSGRLLQEGKADDHKQARSRTKRARRRAGTADRRGTGPHPEPHWATLPTIEKVRDGIASHTTPLLPKALPLERSHSVLE